MAKRRKGSEMQQPADGGSTLLTGADAIVGGAEKKVLDFAEDLGRMLGTAERKANEWLSQRKAVTAQLTQLRDKATQLLQSIGDAPSPWAAPKRRPGRPSGSTSPATVEPKKRTMSAKARKAISDAQKKRWAKQKAAAK